MIKFVFEDWLTFNQAAEYLTETIGQECPESLIEKAVYKGALTAYFYAREQLGLYIDKKEHYEKTGQLNAAGPDFLKNYRTPKTFRAYNSVNEPIPIINYKTFKRALNFSGKLSYPCGLTVFDENKELLGGIYDIDEDGCPGCIGKLRHLVLIPRTDLDQLAELELKHWIHHRSSKPHMLITETQFPIFSQPMLTVRLPNEVPLMDVQLEEDFINNKPAVIVKREDPSAENGLVGTQRALALMVHLLAQVTEHLDGTSEYKSKPASERYSLTTDDGKPIISKISTYLTETAKRQKLTGPGLSTSTFQKQITAALKEHGL